MAPITGDHHGSQRVLTTTCVDTFRFAAPRCKQHRYDHRLIIEASHRTQRLTLVVGKSANPSSSAKRLFARYLSARYLASLALILRYELATGRYNDPVTIYVDLTAETAVTRDNQPSRSNFDTMHSRCLSHRDRHKVKARFIGSPVVRFYGSAITLFRDRP